MQRFDICVLEKALGYTFKNKALLQEALTHSSYSNELKAKKQICRCNERLEFLGDAVLSAVVSEYLFEKFPIFYFFSFWMIFPRLSIFLYGKNFIKLLIIPMQCGILLCV